MLKTLYQNVLRCVVSPLNRFIKYISYTGLEYGGFPYFRLSTFDFKHVCSLDYFGMKYLMLEEYEKCFCFQENLIFTFDITTYIKPKIQT